MPQLILYNHMMSTPIMEIDKVHPLPRVAKEAVDDMADIVIRGLLAVVGNVCCVVVPRLTTLPPSHPLSPLLPLH